MSGGILGKVTVRYSCPGVVEEVLEYARRLATLHAPGVLHYHYARPDQLNTLHITEVYQDESALSKDLACPEIQDIFKCVFGTENAVSFEAAIHCSALSPQFSQNVQGLGAHISPLLCGYIIHQEAETSRMSSTIIKSPVMLEISISEDTGQRHALLQSLQTLVDKAPAEVTTFSIAERLTENDNKYLDATIICDDEMMLQQHLLTNDDVINTWRTILGLSHAVKCDVYGQVHASTLAALNGIGFVTRCNKTEAGYIVHPAKPDGVDS